LIVLKLTQVIFHTVADSLLETAKKKSRICISFSVFFKKWECLSWSMILPYVLKLSVLKMLMEEVLLNIGRRKACKKTGELGELLIPC
jgi:hypothetical protein